MKSLCTAIIATIALSLAACAADDPDDEAIVSTETSSLAAGCTAATVCSGAKTCGAWTPYSACSAPYSGCSETCGFQTRYGCQTPALLQGQNRQRTCTMHSNGATCIDIDYRTVQLSCPVSY